MQTRTSRRRAVSLWQLGGRWVLRGSRIRGPPDKRRAPGCARGLEDQTGRTAGCDGLERNVVVARGRARRRAGRGGGEVVRVDGDVRAGAEAVARRAALVARAREELDRVGDDVYRLALLAVLALPLAPLEAAVDGDRPALGEVAGAVLALRAPDGDVEVVGLVDPLVGRVVLAARVARDAQLADRGAARERAELGICGEVAGDDHPVDVRRGHARTAPFGVARKRRRLVRPSVDRGSDGPVRQPGFSADLLQSRRRGDASDSEARRERALRWARSGRARASPAGRACPARA